MLVRLLSVLALTGAFLVGVSAPASAGYGCPGDRDVWREYRDSAGTVAATAQAHDVANNGLCVQLVSRGPYQGVEKFMKIRVCNTAREDCQVDQGRFKTYAGPIYRDRNCVAVRSTMYDGNGGLIMDHWVYLGACN